MRLTTMVPAVLGLLLAGGCNSLDVGDLNNPGLEGLQNTPTRSGVLTAATGLQIGGRSGVAAQNGYVALLAITGREGYNLDPADPRFVTEMLIGPLDGGSPAFGGNLFGEFYANIRNGNIIIRALEKVTGMTAEEKEATLGYTQTLQAYDFLRVINTRDDNGAPVDVDIDPTAAPAAVATKAEVFTHIANLLDSAKTHLQAGGAAFPLKMSAGYAGFDTPATFLQFNRALRARVAVYTGDFAGALTALGESFINPTGDLKTGVYQSFSTTSGDSANFLFDPNARALFAHPVLRTAAQKQADLVTLDQRVLDKTSVLATPKSVQGITTDLVFNIYKTPSDPVPIIRNEELILLRAEASIGLGDAASLLSAVSDINIVRQTAGKLPAYAGPVTQAALLDELLYNKRYSLLFEGGHSWIDYRRYNKLGTLPRDLPAHRFFNRFPFPTNECLARSTQPAQGCSPEAGF